MSEDPIGLKGGDVNFYAYAHQNPVNLIDPFGLWTISLSGTINVNLGFGSFSYSGGFVVDSSGDIGVYNTVGEAGRSARMVWGTFLILQTGIHSITFRRPKVVQADRWD